MLKFITICMALILSLGGYANATTYNYTGTNFIDGLGSYTSGMSVTGSITTSSPIPENSVNYDITPLISSWTFFDGLQTISSTNGGSIAYNPNIPLPLAFNTDALGNITFAQIQMHAGPWTETTGSTNNFITVRPEEAEVLIDLECTEVFNGICSLYEVGPGVGGFSSGAIALEGSWETTVAPPIPTISVWGLGILAGLLGLIGFVRHRKG